MSRTLAAVVDGVAVAVDRPTRALVNPADESTIGDMPRAPGPVAASAVDAADRAWRFEWRRSTPSDRAAALLAIADHLATERADYAALDSANVGMPIAFAEAVVDAAIDTLRFFAGAARTMVGVPAGEYVSGMTSVMRRESIGPVVAFVPWNVPLLMAVWKVAPALAAGNSIVVRPSSRTPLSALRLAEVVAARNLLPPGVLNVVAGDHDEVAKTLITHPEVALVALTGSVEAGRSIARLAGEHAKRMHLELGGKTPIIVCEDADIGRAAERVAAAALDNAGQDCTAATRVLAVGKIRDHLADALQASLRAVRIGAPADRATELGPLIGRDRRDAVMSHVDHAVRQGARPILEVAPVGEVGWFVSPGLLVDVSADHAIASTEIFGPVVTVEACATDADAVARANGSRYALAAGVWTSSLSRALSITAELNAGKVWVNEHHRDVTEMPHGGTRDSGFGSDLSVLALDHYTRPKAIHIAMEDQPW